MKEPAIGRSDGEEAEAAPGVLVLPPSIEQERDGSDDSLGSLGRPFDRRSPFFIGLSGAFGVAVAYVLFRGVSDVSSVLVIIGVALFIAIGLSHQAVRRLCPAVRNYTGTSSTFCHSVIERAVAR